MNPEQRHLTSLDKTKQLGAGEKAGKSFDLFKSQSEMSQQIEKLKQRLSAIQIEQKQLKNPLEGNAHMNEAILAYQEAHPELDKLYKELKLVKNILEEEKTNKCSLERFSKNQEEILKSLKQELQEKNKNLEEPKAWLTELKISKKAIDDNLKRETNISQTLRKAFHTLKQAIQYPLQLSDGQEGNDKVEPGPASESFHLNQSEHSQAIQQLRDGLQHLGEIDKFLGICKKAEVPSIEREQRDLQERIESLKLESFGLDPQSLPKPELNSDVCPKEEKYDSINSKAAFEEKIY